MNIDGIEATTEGKTVTVRLDILLTLISTIEARSAHFEYCERRMVHGDRVVVEQPCTCGHDGALRFARDVYDKYDLTGVQLRPADNPSHD